MMVVEDAIENGSQVVVESLTKGARQRSVKRTKWHSECSGSIVGRQSCADLKR